MQARTRWGVFLLAAAGLLACAGARAQGAADCLLGDVRLFAGNFEPVGWRFARGQTLSISENESLFSLLLTTWGGDGIMSFNLPNLSSRIPVGTGQGPGLVNVSEGTAWGTEQTVLMSGHLPSHRHLLAVAGGAAATAAPAAGMALAPVQNAGAFAAATPDTRLASGSVGFTGSNQPVELSPPSLGLNYIICVGGSYPPRN